MEIEEFTSRTNKELTSQAQLNDALQKTIERLELDISKQKSATSEVVGKLAAHDAAAKRAITVLQKEMGARIEQVSQNLLFLSLKNKHTF